MLTNHARPLVALTAIAGALLLSGCITVAEPDPTDTASAVTSETAAPSPTPSETPLPSPSPSASPSPTTDAEFWALLPNGDTLHTFIDEDAAAGNCDMLQDYFDTWEPANIDTGAKVDLLEYLDDKMTDAGCYE